MNPDFDATPLVPAVVQDARTGEVRMVGYMNREAYEKTLETRWLHFFSRSRGRLWMKGETSGNRHRVTAVSGDCDGDALLVQAVPEGPTCHTGEPSCFFEPILGPAGAGGTLQRLESVVADRKARRPAGSYTASLLDAGAGRVAQKVGEEAVETVVAALSQERERVVQESADLLYHLLVLWSLREVTLAEVCEALMGRAGAAP